MNDGKSAAAQVEAGRLVRDFVQALNSLKATTSRSDCAASAEEQLPSQLDDAESELEQEMELECVESSTAPDAQIENESASFNKVVEFRNDRDLIQRLQVTPHELEVLSRVSLLGTLTCKQDLLFILRQIREAGELEARQGTVLPVAPCPPHQKELGIPGANEKAERIRREAMSKMAEADSTISRKRGQLLRFRSLRRG